MSQGDTILVDTGSSALLILSDGTESSIGSPLSASQLKLDALGFGGDKGFLTKIRLSLAMGEIDTKAPRLRQAHDGQSTLDVVSGNAVATVRGTVFGVERIPGTGYTEISLTVGKLAISDLLGNPLAVL